MSSNSLWNPFLFSVFRDPRTWEKDSGGDSGGGGGDDNNSSSTPVITNQDKINEIYAANDGQWDSSKSEELNALTADRTGTYSGGSTATTASSSGGGGGGGSTTTLGSVSQTGQYAGDGFEWVQNPNTNALTRVYTGANEDAGLGQEVIAGGTANNATKALIADISLNEGSEFANSQTSATDGSVFDLFRDDDDQVGSGSYADQVGTVDYTPTITYDSTQTGAENAAAVVAPVTSFGDTFAENRAAGNATFEYDGNIFTTDLASDAPAAGTPTFNYDAFGTPYSSPAAASQADLVAEAQASSAQNAITSANNAIFDPRGDQIQSPTSNGSGITSLGEDDVVSTGTGQVGLDANGNIIEYGTGDEDSTDFSYVPTTDSELKKLVEAKNTDPDSLSSADYLKALQFERTQQGTSQATTPASVTNPFGSELPNNNMVADASGGFNNYIKNLIFGEDETSAPGFDAFGTEYATAEQAAQADVDMNNASVMANNPNFQAQFPGDLPEGLISSSADIPSSTPDASNLSGSDLLKYVAIGIPEMIGESASGVGDNLKLTSPLNTLQGFTQQNSGLMSIPIALTNRIVESFMSPEEKQRRIFASNPNQQGSLMAEGLKTSGDFLSNTVSPYIRDFLKPGTQQGVFEGDFGGDVSMTGVNDGKNLTGIEAAQGTANLVAKEGFADVLVDKALGKTIPTRVISAVANAGEQLTGFTGDISTQVDNAYVSGTLDDNQIFKDALKAQDGNVDDALAVVKNLAYVDGYKKIAGSGALDAVIPGAKSGLGGFAKDLATRTVVEGTQGGYEGYQAITSINNVLGTEFDPTKNIVGNVLTEAAAGGGATAVVGGVQNLTARQRRDAADEAALTGQPVVGPYGGMDTSGITPGFNKARSPGSAGNPGTIEGQFTVYDPTQSESAGDPASSSVLSSYDLEGTGSLDAAAITDQRDPMTTSMESMAAQEVINDQVNQTGTVDVGILQRIQKATGLSMNELGSMVSSATSNKLTAAEIAAIQGASTGEIMTKSPSAPSLDDEVTGNFGGSNIAVKPNPDGTTTLTAPSGRISVVDVGQDLDQAIKVFDEVTTPIDVQTVAPALQGSAQDLTNPDFTSAPFSSPSLGGISTLGIPSGMDAKFVAPASGTAPAVMDVSPAQQAINYGAIQAQEAAYTAAKGATGDDAKAEAAGQAAYNNFLRTSSDMPVASTVGTSPTVVTSSGTVTPAAGTGSLDAASAIGTGTDLAVANNGTTDVLVDGTTDLTTAATTDLTVGGDTDTDTDTTSVTVFDDAIDGTATEISGVLTDQTTDTDTKTKVAVVPNTDIKVLTEVEPPEEEVIIEEDEEEVVTSGTDDIDDTDIFVPVTTSTDEDGNIVNECPEGFELVITEDGPVCQKITKVVSSQKRRGISVGKDTETGLAGNRGRTSPGQNSKTTTSSTTESVAPTTRVV